MTVQMLSRMVRWLIAGNFHHGVAEATDVLDAAAIGKIVIAASSDA